MILGEPGDRTALSIEDTIRREYERWMVVEEQDSGPSDDRDTEDDEVNDIGSAKRGAAE